MSPLKTVAASLVTATLVAGLSTEAARADAPGKDWKL